MRSHYISESVYNIIQRENYACEVLKNMEIPCFVTSVVGHLSLIWEK